MKYTPGPWEAVFDEAYYVKAADGGRVAISTNLKGPHGMEGRRAGNEVAGNTLLIAAAPEMFEVLMSLVRRGRYRGCLTIYQEDVLEIEAAIAKAQGGVA